MSLQDEYKCLDCGLKFSSEIKLTTHQRKYCFTPYKPEGQASAVSASGHSPYSNGHHQNDGSFGQEGEPQHVTSLDAFADEQKRKVLHGQFVEFD